MGLSCCKKIKVENRSDEIKKGKVRIEYDEQFSLPMVLVDFDGFLTAQCSGKK